MTSHDCTMPEHGQADAVHACCRPAPPRPETPPRSGFWSDPMAWRRAAGNTAHCLLGCALGDIAAMTLVPLWWPTVPFGLLMAIAIASGLASSLLLETIVLRLREGFPWRRALHTALGMSLLSMIVMELVMNGVDWLAMGGQRLPMHDLHYWAAWVPALLAGFLAPLPYNYYMLKRHARSCH